MATSLVCLSIHIENGPKGRLGLVPTKFQSRMNKVEISLGPQWNINSTQFLKKVHEQPDLVDTDHNKPFQSGKILGNVSNMGISILRKLFLAKKVSSPKSSQKNSQQS
jgi:hypothetical protein